MSDLEGRGAGWARNTGAQLANTPFVYFLDADDTIRPDAIETLLPYYRQGAYVYSDDQQGDSIHQTPDCGAYLDGTWHTVNALIPTAAFKAVGGFDETLPALEDLDLFLKLQAARICGVRCPHVLVKYTAGGQRSKTFQQQPDYVAQKQTIYQRWSGVARTMCNCGTAVNGLVPDGKVDTDILVTALYSKRPVNGPVTGRPYQTPRGVDNYQLWVDPRDVEARPDWWSPVVTVNKDVTPAVEDVMRMYQEAVK